MIAATLLEPMQRPAYFHWEKNTTKSTIFTVCMHWNIAPFQLLFLALWMSMNLVSHWPGARDNIRPKLYETVPQDCQCHVSSEFPHFTNVIRAQPHLGSGVCGERINDIGNIGGGGNPDLLSAVQDHPLSQSSVPTSRFMHIFPHFLSLLF